jgi:Polyketide cyclase / dehydrase and lipid transport
MLFWIILIVIVLVALVLIYGVSQPASFSVVREADFKAPPKTVFSQINDFHNWSAWSPWEKMDPNLQRNFSGPSSGVGAKYTWVGNKKVGQGNMEITNSVPSKGMQLDLNFIKPFQASNVTEFTLTPNGKGTHLKWEMRGHAPFVFRVMRLFFSMDKIVGTDFERGLANLRGIVDA